MALLLVSTSACHKAPAEPTPAANAAVTRGARVVVEVEAAQFFEARVLGVDKNRVKLERNAGAEPLIVSLGDVYRVPSDTPLRQSGQYGICHFEARWRGCRVEALSPPELVVHLLDGNSEKLAPVNTISASPSTELNLRRAFSRAREQAAFKSEAARAGLPVAPEGFRPSTGLRVVAHRLDDSWQSGIVRSVGKEGVVVSFSPDDVQETLGSVRLLPDPTPPSALSHLDFVLLRPASPAEPWRVGRVIAAVDRSVRVAGVDGVERSVNFRDVLRLEPATGGK